MLANEEALVRPQALYILGHVRRLQQRFVEAQQFCEEALASAETNQDPGCTALAGALVLPRWPAPIALAMGPILS